MVFNYLLSVSLFSLVSIMQRKLCSAWCRHNIKTNEVFELQRHTCYHSEQFFLILFHNDFKATRGSFSEQTFRIPTCFLSLLTTLSFLLGAHFRVTFAGEKMNKTKEERHDNKRGWLGQSTGQAIMNNLCSCLF